MGLMAFLAISGSLLGKMRFVALGASRNLAVSAMARTAEERGMLALVFTQFSNLTGVAGQTGVGNVAECYDERRMGVRMAAGASSQFVMWFSFMALAAERDDLACRGRMPVMTVLAADLRFVLTTCCSNIGRRLAVTFDTVIVL